MNDKPNGRDLCDQDRRVPRFDSLDNQREGVSGQPLPFDPRIRVGPGSIGQAHQITMEQVGIQQSPQRKYLPTLSDLIDRLTIVQLKEVFIHEKRDEYAKEMALLMHDIDLTLKELGKPIGANEIRSIVVIMLANRFIWENESTIRDNTSNEDATKQLQRLKATHSINGVRNNAKNALSQSMGGRQDYKVDCFASELIEEFGNWNIFR